MDYYGYAGKILEVDLTTEDIKKRPLDLDLARDFVGSCGLSYHWSWDLMKPGMDPLAPESPILIGAGPLIGTLAPGSGQIEGTVKFPLPATQQGKYCIGSGSGGSRHFGLMLKNAGYDHIIITGKATKPVYLEVIDDHVEICDAADLWAQKDIYETTEEFQRRYGRCGVIAIGAAGENLVRFAFATIDNRSTLGRNGFGAVMGSKNLKAIVVRGTKGIKVADPTRFMRVVDKIRSLAPQSPFYQPYHELGLHAGWEDWKIVMNPGRWPKVKWDELYGIEVCKDNLKDIHACSACILGCRTAFQAKRGRFAGAATQTGHFLHIATLGQALNTDEVGAVLKIQDTLNRAGMCASAFGAIASFLTTLFERGNITKKETQGLELSRTYESFIQLAEHIIYRKGLGDTIAEGWFATGDMVGLDLSTTLGLQKGALIIYDARNTKLDPRIFHTLVNPRGAHHPQAHWITSIPEQSLEKIKVEAKKMGLDAQAMSRIFQGDTFDVGRITKHVQDNGMVTDSLGLCTLYNMFGLEVNMETMAELYSSATGIEMSPGQLKLCGEKAFNLFKLLNVREGFDRRDDRMPDSWMRPKKTADGVEVLMDFYRKEQLSREDVEHIIDNYYQERGWDKEKGIPRSEKLAELELTSYVRQSHPLR